MKKTEKEFRQISEFVHFQNAQMPSNGGFNRDVRCVNQVLRTSKEGPKRDEIVQPAAAQLDDGLLDLPKMPEFLGLITHPLRGGQEAA